jgi:uncharacterized protein
MKKITLATPRRVDCVLSIEVAKISQEGLVFQVEVAPEELHLPSADAVLVEMPIRIQGLFTKVAQQIYFRGSLYGRVTVPCSRCLETMQSDFVTEVQAVFFPSTSAVAADEASGLSVADELDLYEHNGITLDLEPLVHDQVVLSFPVQPLCRDDCAGLCQVCGANRNEQPCACQVEREASPFAVLKQLDI